MNEKWAEPNQRVQFWHGHLHETCLRTAPAGHIRPPLPRLTRWRQAMHSRYWRLRWWLAEKIAGEKIYDRDGDD